MNVDFHVHTCYSRDSFSTPERILRHMKRINLDGIAITDHHSIIGAEKTRKIAEKRLVIIGTEIKTEFGDMVGIFLNQEIRGRTFLEVIDEIRSQDGLVVLPHPFKYGQNLRFPGKYLKKIDFVETLNARIKISQNFKAKRLAESLKMNKIAGSDAHLTMEIGNAFLRVGREREIYTEEEVRKKLLKGPTKERGRETPEIISLLSRGMGKISKVVK